jgi:hypothetical protein
METLGGEEPVSFAQNDDMGIRGRPWRDVLQLRLATVGRLRRE